MEILFIINIFILTNLFWILCLLSFFGPFKVRSFRCFLAIVILLILIILYSVAFYFQKLDQPKSDLPIQQNYNVKKIQAEISAFNSLSDQTDDSPFIMASGKRVFDGALANNCLPFGTEVIIKGKIYQVQDRMNSRYGCNHFDIFMWHKVDALAWGRKQVPVYIIN